MTRPLRRALLACVLLLAASCASREPDDLSPDPATRTTTLSVENRGYLDMTIYLLDGGRRVRLGVANGNTVTDLPIPPSLVRGAMPLRFLCDPIGGSHAPVSDEIYVEPGDQVTLVIPAS